MIKIEKIKTAIISVRFLCTEIVVALSTSYFGMITAIIQRSARLSTYFETVVFSGLGTEHLFANI